MLQLENLAFQTILRGISAQFLPGSVTAILGANGSGKTTLLKTICRILQPTNGSIQYCEQDLGKMNRQEVSRILTMVPQNAPVPFDYCVEEFLKMARYRKKKAPELVREALTAVDAQEFTKRPMQQLSQGERQRIYIARSLVTEAPIILLDEPTAHLDRRHRSQIWKLLHQLAKQGKTLLIANHDLENSRLYCDTALFLEKGTLVASGKTAEVLDSQSFRSIY